MAYTPENNPYIPGDPYSYDLKWVVNEIDKWKTSEDAVEAAAASAQAASQSAEDAAASTEAAADSAQAAAGSEAAAKDYAENIADPVSGLVSSWLTEHITQPTTPAIDTSLTVAGAAADAKVTGDGFTIEDRKIVALNNSLLNYYQKSFSKNLYNYKASIIGEIRPDTGLYVNNSNRFVSDFIPVNPGTRYRFVRFSSVGAVVNLDSNLVTEYDDNKELIPGSTGYTSDITTPDNCYYIKFSGLINHRNIAFVVEGGTPAANSYESFKDLYEVIIAARSLTPLLNTRNCVINFQFDDALANDSTIYTIFNNALRKCGFAVPSTIVSNAGQLQRYLSYQDAGFEILSHSTSSATPTTEDPIRESKAALSNAGFNINGWVTPASALPEAYRKWLRKYYKYAYTVYYGEHSSTDINPSNIITESEYNLSRVSLESTQTYDLLINAVDNAISAGGMLTFYAHSQYLNAEGHGAFTTSNLINLINYIKGKEDEGYCRLLTPYECYQNYYCLRHDDLYLLNN